MLWLWFLAAGLVPAGDSAEALNNLGARYYELGKYTEADAAFERAVGAWKSRPAAPRGGLWRTLGNLALLRSAEGRYAEAESIYLGLVEDIEAGGAGSPELATALNNLADLYRNRGAADKALPLAERSLRIARRLYPPGDVRLVRHLHTLGAVYRGLDRIDEAAALFERCRASLERDAAATDKRLLAAVLNNLGEIASARGRYPQAEALARQALALWEQVLTPGHPRVAIALNNLAQALRRQERYEEAEPLYRRAIAIMEQAPGAGTLELARFLANLADMHHDLGRDAAAVAAYRRAIDLMAEALGRDQAELALLISRLAEVRRSQRHYIDSVRLYRRSIAILEHCRSPQLVQSYAAYQRVLKEADRVILRVE